ncbi:hypothetical protein R5R35_005567 [Gryllus longicercus]|uniref:Uncharacterized protein n=1 Tax=Gryllus longicercus TaxID=2509291 RepID=A0AAN9VXA2_9ORTH
MAVESCTARLVRHAAEAALRMRQPARRAAGSVPAAATVAAVLVGMYNIILGTIYYSEKYHFYFGLQGLVNTASCLAFAASLADAVLIFGVLRRKEEYLHSIVCATLAVYMLCGLMPLCVVIGLAINMKWIFMLWEVPRLLAYPVHVCVLYCLLAEVRGESPAQGLGAAPAADGWLKNNLARAGHAPLAADGVLLKLPATGPAPVHFGSAPPPASGPLSSSDA